MALTLFSKYCLVSCGCLVHVILDILSKDKLNMDLIEFNRLILQNNWYSVVVQNFVIMVALLFISTVLDYMIGQIREIDLVNVIDQIKFNIFDLAFIILYIDFSGNELNTSQVIKLVLLNIIEGIQLLVQSKSEYVFTVANHKLSTYVKIYALFLLLIIINFYIIFSNYSVFSLKTLLKMENTNSFHDSLSTIIGFQVIQHSIKFWNYFIKYITNIFELYSEIQLQNKDIVFCYIDLVLSFLKNIFRFLQLQYYNKFLPYYLLAYDYIILFKQFQSSIKNFVGVFRTYTKINQLPEYTQSKFSQTVDNTCTVCLQEVKSGKMLSCNHVFHFNCLRQWLATQKVECPKCRTKIQLDQIKEQQEKNNRYNEKISYIIKQRLPSNTETGTIMKNVDENPAFSKFISQYENVNDLQEKYTITKLQSLANNGRRQEQSNGSTKLAQTEDDNTNKQYAVCYGPPVEAIPDRNIDDLIKLYKLELINQEIINVQNYPLLAFGSSQNYQDLLRI